MMKHCCMYFFVVTLSLLPTSLLAENVPSVVDDDALINLNDTVPYIEQLYIEYTQDSDIS